MVFTVSPKTNKKVEDILIKAMDELNNFFDIGWVRNTPKVFLLKDRKTIDLLKERKTKRGVIGFCRGRDIYLLDPKNYQAESSYEYNKEDFAKLIKHELCHLFLNVTAGKDSLKPVWLMEGLCVYVSGQYKRYDEIPALKTFLDFYDFDDKPNYKEAGFAVKFLVEKYGKQKLFKLLKSLRNYQTQTEFKKLFKEVYNFDLDYKSFNTLSN